MKPVTFPEQNAVYGENQQPIYEPLPAYRTTEGQVVSCWQLSEEEKKRVAETGQIWLSVLTFGQPLQPLYLTAEKSDLFNNPQ